MSQENPHGFVDAASASASLSVSRSTLYAYVSRGLIRSVPQPGNSRARLYVQADVDRLVWRKNHARRPSAAVATALDWGLPILETHISQIEKGRLTYRGRDITALAGHASLEDVAVLLWDAHAAPFDKAHFDPALVPGWAGTARIKANAPPVDRALALLALMDPSASSARRPENERLAAAVCLVRALACAMASAKLDATKNLHDALAETWQRPDAREVIRRILVCCADHELNAASFAVRVVASMDADLTSALLAGLGAFRGLEHVTAFKDVRVLLEEAAATDDLEDFVRQRTGRNGALPGFFHRLYPEGDPRAAAIMAHMPVPPAAAKLIDSVARLTGLRPNVELALVITETGYGLGQEAAETLFTISRSIGWIAHAIEQQKSGVRIRPRACSRATEL
mgnify:CR=1 FL=1